MTSLKPSPGFEYRSVTYFNVRKLDWVKMVPISALVDRHERSAYKMMAKDEEYPYI